MMSNTAIAMAQAMTAGLDPADLIALASVAFIAGLARGFSGFGGALIFMPLASSLVDPKLAAVTLFLSDAAMGLPLVPNALRSADRREVSIMVAGAALSAPLGTALLAYADPLALRWLIVALAGAMLALLASGWRYRGQPSPPLTIGTGLIAGLFGAAAQIGGPPIVAYWLGGPKNIAVVRANIVLYFALATFVTAANYAFAGFFALPGAGLALIVGPLYGLGLFSGSRFFGRANEQIFRRICLFLIGLSAVISLPVLDGVLR